MRITLFMLALVVCSTAHAQEPTGDILDKLRAMPEVRSVTVAGEGEKSVFILRDFHHIPLDLFSLDLIEQIPCISTSAIDKAYEGFLADVNKVQSQQAVVLKLLADKGTKTVFKEGLTDIDLHVLRATVKVMKEYDGDPDALQRLGLPFGAPTRLLADGVDLDVKGLDTDESLKVGDPLRADGRLGFDKEKNEEREDIMVGILSDWLVEHDAAVVILGSAHNLQDNFATTEANVRLVIVDVKELPRD